MSLVVARWLLYQVHVGISDADIQRHIDQCVECQERRGGIRD